MFKNEQEIIEAVNAFRVDSNFTTLKKRWEGDFDLYRLKPYDAGTGYFSYTSNLVRVSIDKALSMQEGAKLLIRIPEDSMTDEDKRIAGNVERFIYGSLNFNDEYNLKLPGKRTLRQSKSWYSTLRGSWAERIYVYKDAAGITRPEITVWDIYNTSYGTGNDGLDWAAYSYKMPAIQAMSTYGLKNLSGMVSIIDYWDSEKNMVIVDGKSIYNNAHGLKHCPVFIFKVGSAPLVWQDNWNLTDTITGESFLAAIRGLVPIINKALSDLLTIVRRGVKTPMGLWSASGDKTIDQDIFQVERAAVVPFKLGEEFKPLMTQSMPPDASGLVNLVVGEFQRATFSYSSYGEVQTRLSGYAINQLNESMETVIQPFIDALCQSYLVDSLELIQQYGGSSLTPVEVRGRTSRDKSFGYPKAAQIAPKDVIGTWHPEVTLETVLPKDEPTKIEMAQMLRQGNVPLLSDQTIRSEVLGIQDPDLEDTLVAREWADNQIINRLYRAYVEASRPGNDPMMATNILAALKMAMQASGQGGQNPPMPGLEPTSKSNPQGKGFSAAVLPPETNGGTPPGAANAVPPPPIGQGV